MAVLLETSKGDLVIDLFAEECPLATRNFLKLCKYAISSCSSCRSHKMRLNVHYSCGCGSWSKSASIDTAILCLLQD